jgi:hypothetical protein
LSTWSVNASKTVDPNIDADTISRSSTVILIPIENGESKKRFTTLQTVH